MSTDRDLGSSASIGGSLSSSRLPELDALRALAAFVVLLFHLRPQRFTWGWTGVDLFFVLSGYLITTIILGHRGTPGFVRNFYARRSLRIWPIYYLALIGLVISNRWLPRPQPMDGLFYYLTYTQNVRSYWHRSTPPFHPAFDHTWTLALEEQFYLIWPALIALAGSGRLVRLCVAVVVVNLLARHGGFLTADPYPERILIARSDGFALGGLLAALLFDRDRLARRLREFRLAFGLAWLVGGAYLGWGMSTGGAFLGLPTPAWPALTIFMIEVFYFGLIGTVLLAAGGPATAILRVPALVYLGQISYGIYLYHYIIYWIIDGFRFDYDRPWWVGVGKVAATVAAAMASWHLIERPILGLKRWFRYDAADRGARPLAPP